MSDNAIGLALIMSIYLVPFALAGWILWRGK